MPGMTLLERIEDVGGSVIWVRMTKPLISPPCHFPILRILSKNMHASGIVSDAVYFILMPKSVYQGWGKGI